MVTEAICVVVVATLVAAMLVAESGASGDGPSCHSTREGCVI